MASESALKSVANRSADILSWMRSVAAAVNGLLRGGPHIPTWKQFWTTMDSGLDGAGASPTFGSFLGNVELYSFSQSVTNELHFTFVIDHDYAIGSDLYPAVLWTSDSISQTVVRWGIEYTIAKGYSQAQFPSTTTLYYNDTCAGTAWTHQSAEFAAIDGPSVGAEPGAVLVMRIFRDGGDAADTCASGALGLAVGLRYQVSRHGTANREPDFYEP